MNFEHSVHKRTLNLSTLGVKALVSHTKSESCTPLSSSLMLGEVCDSTSG